MFGAYPDKEINTQTFGVHRKPKIATSITESFNQTLSASRVPSARPNCIQAQRQQHSHSFAMVQISIRTDISGLLSPHGVYLHTTPSGKPRFEATRAHTCHTGADSPERHAACVPNTAMPDGNRRIGRFAWDVWVESVSIWERPPASLFL